MGDSSHEIWHLEIYVRFSRPLNSLLSQYLYDPPCIKLTLPAAFSMVHLRDAPRKNVTSLVADNENTVLQEFSRVVRVTINPVLDRGPASSGQNICCKPWRPRVSYMFRPGGLLDRRGMM